MPQEWGRRILYPLKSSFQSLERTTSEGEGIAQYFSGRFPGPVSLVSRAVYTPDPVLQGSRSLYTLRACRVSRALRVE